MEEEQVKAEARNEARKASYGMPFRFFCMPGEGAKEIIIVDEAPDFFRHEHALKNKATGRYDNFTPCIDEHANCPVCATSTDRSPYFAMYLTIIDLTPYEGKNGTVEWTKKLLVAKPSQQKKLMRLYDRHKSLRGMILSLTRDTDKDAAIGNDIEFVEFMDENDLLSYETTYTDKENKEHTVIGHEVFNYDELFPEMSEKQLIALAGGRPQQGSREANRKALGDDWEEPAARGTRPASRRAPAAAEGEDDDLPAPAPRRGARAAPEPDPEPAPRRTRGARAAPEPEQEEDDPNGEHGDPDPAPTRRASRRTEPEPEQEEEDVDPATGLPWDDEPEPTPAQRRSAPRAAAPAPSRRTAAEDDAPQRGSASVAARRASLRR